MFADLKSWLAWQETLHPNSIDLGLDRIRAVLQRLQFHSPQCPVITIAGTKGKGSTAALLGSIYSAAGYRAGVFTSPHLRRYNERIQINQQEVSDETLCVAFERINAARGDVSLTYFEFNTLAALLAFSTANLDVWILEVGMGGRLDAVNVIDADVAMVTSIGIDHTEWLGSDLESIGREKAGIFRTDRPALYGGTEMPASIQRVAEQTRAALLRAGQDFDFQAHDTSWSWWMQSPIATISFSDLPIPAISGGIQLRNASLSLAAVQLLAQRLSVSRAALDQGLRSVSLEGRFQRIQSQSIPDAQWILDVAHNPMSAAVLAMHLKELAPPKRKIVAIIGMLSNKDVQGTLGALSPLIDAWIATGLSQSRALTGAKMVAHLHDCNAKVIGSAEDVVAACKLAKDHAKPGDCILICGFV